jgi:hypothetical protein
MFMVLGAYLSYITFHSSDFGCFYTSILSMLQIYKEGCFCGFILYCVMFYIENFVIMMQAIRRCQMQWRQYFKLPLILGGVEA